MIRIRKIGSFWALCALLGCFSPEDSIIKKNIPTTKHELLTIRDTVPFRGDTFFLQYQISKKFKMADHCIREGTFYNQCFNNQTDSLRISCYYNEFPADIHISDAAIIGNTLSEINMDLGNNHKVAYEKAVTNDLSGYVFSYGDDTMKYYEFRGMVLPVDTKNFLEIRLFFAARWSDSLAYPPFNELLNSIKFYGR